MPISVQCACGHKLNVPDNLAGKQGKCPKCQQLIKIPGVTGQVPKAAPAAPSASPRKAPPAPVVDSGLAAMLEEAGVGKKTGPACPKCNTPIRPGAVLCTKCGLNFGTGEQLKQHEVDSEFSFGNLYLDEAVSNMKRDDVMQDRHEKAGLPWWVMVVMFLFVIIAGIGAVLIVDAQLMGPQDPNTLVGWVQQFRLTFLIGALLGITATLLNFFAVLVTLIHAFMRDTVKGIMVLFVPFYIFYYQIVNWAEMQGAFLALILASVLGGGAGALLAMGAGAQ